MIHPILLSGMAASVLLAGTASAQDAASVGARPSYSFREAPANSMGVKSLEELKGRPVLVEFWGTY